MGTRKQIEKGQKEKLHLENTNGEAEHQSEEEEKTKGYVRENEGREAPGSRWEKGPFENVCDLSVVISLGESCPCSAAL